MNLKLRGLIIKQTNYSEADKILTVFTDELGIIQINARGARRYKSKQAASTQLFCYNDFVVFKNKENFSLNSAECIESFYKIREDVKKLSLASYLCDITYAALNLQNPDTSILRLLLNTLYVIAKKDYNIDKIKFVYEMRMLAFSGFYPKLDECVLCGKREKINSFSIKRDGVMCDECKSYLYECLPMSLSTYHSLTHILTSEDNKLFSFNVPDKDIKEMNDISERFVSRHLDNEFNLLDFYKKI